MPDTHNPNESPSVWFAALESALRFGEAQVEAEALRELRRLGVVVEINPAIAARRWLRRPDAITNRPRPRPRRSRSSEGAQP